MVGAPGWHFEFVPAARPQGSVTLLPAGIQGNSTPWLWTQGKRKRDKKDHTRHPVSEGMLSCYPTELLEEVSLWPQHSRDFLSCYSMSQHTMPRCSDVVVSIYGRRAFKDLDLQLQITGGIWACISLFCFAFFGVFFWFFSNFLTWVVMGEIEREEKREAKIMEKAKSNDTSPPQKKITC